MKPIAIAFSDAHIHNFSQYRQTGKSRVLHTIATLTEIAKTAWTYQVPLLFMGDWYHTPESVANSTNSLGLHWYKEYVQYVGLEMYAISGNHDQEERNSIKNKSSSHLDTLSVFEGFHLMDYSNGSFIRSNEVLLQGIPYMSSNDDLKKEVERLRYIAKNKLGFKILMLHTDIPGAKTPIGFELGESQLPNHLNKYFKEWDLVLCGHIHRPQKLSNKVYMMGATNHQDTGDAGCDMGYWIIYKNNTPKFIPLNIAPKFIKLGKDEIPQDEFNYYIPYTSDQIVVDKVTIDGRFNINAGKEKLAKRYAKKAGITDKGLINALIKILHEAD